MFCKEMVQPALNSATHSLYWVSEDILPGKPGVEPVGDQVSGRQLLLSHGCCLEIFHTYHRLVLLTFADLVQHGRVDVTRHVIVLEVDKWVGV